VSDATITQMLMAEKTFQDASGKFSNELFANYLTSRGMTKEQLFDSVRQDLLVTAFSRGIINTGIFAQGSIDKLMSMQSESRPVQVLRLDWHSFAPQVQVTPQEIASY
ncbi:SurA N-terminal domain-containing protein, partial [Pasteurella multocida]|uniref:SurA N-terminal domain-containing protein n=1 Tax=Pasteurella multocida TaxID=747 RepID=UPI00227CD2C1